MYNQKEKEQFKKILKHFNNMIEQNDTIDVLWSRRNGCVLKIDIWMIMDTCIRYATIDNFWRRLNSFRIFRQKKCIWNMMV